MSSSASLRERVGRVPVTTMLMPENTPSARPALSCGVTPAARRRSIITRFSSKEKKATNLLGALDKSKHCQLDAFLFAIGIPNVGRKTARDLANAFGSLDKVAAATAEQLTAIPDVGDIVAQSVVEFFSFEENRVMIDRLLAAGVNPQESAGRAEGVFSDRKSVV